jgi:penicillin-binding protein 2
MERITRLRASILVGVVCAILLFFAGRLYYMQIIETGGVVDNTTIFVTRTRVKAARGDILDRNGNLMVSNRASFDLVINHYVLTSSENPNQSLYALVKLCDKLEIDYVDHLPITKTAPFTYTLEQYGSTWRNYFQEYLFRRGDGFDSDITAPLLLEKLRESYHIPAEWSDEDARAVLGLRYELSLRTLPNVYLANYVFRADVDSEILSAVSELNIPGMMVEASTVREYNTKYAAHILGYVGAMNPDQWEYYKNLEHLEYAMDAEVGQSGLELAFEEQLHGTDGYRIDYVTKDGTVIKTEYDPAPKAGNNVEVSVDLNLQMVGEDKLAEVMTHLRELGEDGGDAEGAAVVVIDVKTGQVLVCASYPTYDPSLFFENYNQILNTEYRPLVNRALNLAYPPGSTYKMSMVVAAINYGIINQHTPITDYGVYKEYIDSGYAPQCLWWTNYRASHGTLTAAEALRDSCNYFFYYLGDHMSISKIDATAKGLGLGEKTGVELTETSGVRANTDSKKALYSGTDALWYPADAIAASIGQGLNRFTPMQLAVYTATLANEGTRMKATFLSRVVSSDYRSLLSKAEPTVMSQMDISPDAVAAYKEGMRLVCSAKRGTAYSIFGSYPIAVSAKTGTAQNGKGQSDNGAFVCYAPSDDPQIAIAVYGEKAGHGSDMAAVAKAIMDVYFAVNEYTEVITNENQVS